MSDLNATRERLAALVADNLGLGPLASLDAGQRAIVDRKMEALADEATSDEPADPTPSHLREAVQAYRKARRLRADEANVRLAERGEVFAPEDDA